MRKSRYYLLFWPPRRSARVLGVLARGVLGLLTRTFDFRTVSTSARGSGTASSSACRRPPVWKSLTARSRRLRAIDAIACSTLVDFHTDGHGHVRPAAARGIDRDHGFVRLEELAVFLVRPPSLVSLGFRLGRLGPGGGRLGSAGAARPRHGKRSAPLWGQMARSGPLVDVQCKLQLRTNEAP